MEKIDGFCELIRHTAQTPPIDWDRMRGKFNLISGKGLKFGFEIRTINCILTADPPMSQEVAQSLFSYIHPGPKMIGNNPILDIHLAALMGRIDAKQHADAIRDIVVYVSEKHSSFTKFKAYAESVIHLASTSKQNCEIAAKYGTGKGVARKLSLFCLQHGHHELALKTHVPAVENELDVKAWIDSFLASEFREEALHNFLTMMRNVSCVVPPSCSSSLQSLLQRAGYEIKTTELDDNSACTECGTQMAGITDEEYATCIRACKDRVLHKGDAFINSNPQEVSHFLRLINSALQSGNYYDIVIDALNVSHVTQPHIYSLDPAPKFEGRIVKVVKSKAVLTENFKRILTNALHHFPRILVIGRKHMVTWPGLQGILSSKRPHVDYFYLDNQSQDDPFIIYAAMQTRRTYVMSNDFFRDHRFLMDDQLFERWFRSRIVRPPKDTRTFLIPPRHENRINFTPEFRRIHIPVGYNSTSFTTWLCCHKK